MKIHRFKSEALQQYDKGDIIVIANNIIEAKHKALNIARLYFANYYIMAEYCGEGDIKELSQILYKLKNRDSDDLYHEGYYSQYLQSIRYVKNDLKNEPSIYSEGFCIRGAN